MYIHLLHPGVLPQEFAVSVKRNRIIKSSKAQSTNPLIISSTALPKKIPISSDFLAIYGT